MMKTRKIGIIGFVIAVFGITLTLAFRNQGSERESEPSSSRILDRDTSYNKLVDSFFYYFSQKDKLVAFDYLFGTNKYMKTKPEKVENIKMTFLNLLPQLGEYFGYEQITEKRVGNRYVLKSYILLFDRQPLRLNIIFYKPSDKWLLDQIAYDSDLSKELSMAGNIYSLPENMIIVEQKY